MRKLIAAAAIVVSMCGVPAWAQLEDFSELVEKQAPAVVLVTVESGGSVLPEDMPEGGPAPDPLLDMLRRFGYFGRGMPQQPQQQGQVPRSGSGSGFIIEKDGYVLTNAHVVDGASTIRVKLWDKREFKATLVGLDRRTDVALLKIDGKDLPTVTIGSSETLKPGAWVVAIGAPLQLENTVTAGIVSAKERLLDTDELVPFIQHQAPVNQGNSGGPLFNSRGEVVGVNSRIASAVMDPSLQGRIRPAYIGYSFSIPIDLAIKVSQQLRAKGKVSRGRLGVRMQPMSAELAAGFGLDKEQGVIVADVGKGTAAEKSGLQVEDIILAINGKPVNKPGDLARVIASSQAGDVVKLQVWRGGKAQQLTATLDEAVDDSGPQPTQPAPQQEEKGRSGSIGLALRPLRPADLAALKVEFGVEVVAVQGAARAAGIMPGDVIVGVVGANVRTLSDLEKVIKPGARLAFRVLRAGGATFIPLTVPQK